MRIALGLEYDGSLYHGWQRQSNGISVQAVTEDAIARVADHDVHLYCAGRTDTGVHAIGQVAHFDTESRRDERSWILGGNSNLPKSVSIAWACQVSENFHARYKAEWRSYRYIILNRFSRSALCHRYATWLHRPLDAERMQVAGQYLLGEHDFTAFRASECQAKTPVRTLHSLTVQRSNDWIYIDVRANAFLHHMVRNLVGTLIEVGTGEQSLEWPRRLLDGKNRSLAGVTAPPDGLYLTQVGYPQSFNIPLSAYLPVYG